MEDVENVATCDDKHQFPPIPSSPQYVFNGRSQASLRDFTAFSATHGAMKDPGVVLSDKLEISADVQRKVKLCTF